MNFQSLYQRFSSVASYLQPLLLLIIRAYWGIQFVLTGWGKLSHLEKVAGYFESLHLPAPKIMAICAGSTELIGGALLALGLISRFAAFALTCVMCVAYATGDHDSLVEIFHDPDKFTSATPFLFLLASLIVLAFGPGAISVDRAVFPETTKSGK